MSAEDYDECEKLFCGSWAVSEDENIEAYMEAAGMAEQMKAFIRLVNQLTITRVGNMFVEKAVVGGVDVEMKKSINKETEWKDNEENPTFHLKVEFSCGEFLTKCQQNHEQHNPFKNLLTVVMSHEAGRLTYHTNASMLIASFKDGVWSQTTTPLNVDGVKTQAMTSRIEGGDLVTELSLPDVPGVTAKRIYKKV